MPKLFLTDYASYNNGTQFEFGHWVDLEDFMDADQFFEYVAEHFEEADEKSPIDEFTTREEPMFTDYEGFPKWLYGESMSHSDVQKIYDYIEHFGDMDDDDWLYLHNEYCWENRPDDVISHNDEEFFETYFSNDVLGAIRSVYFGDYRWNDKYVVFNGYGNLETFNDPMDHIDETELIEWKLENV